MTLNEEKKLEAVDFVLSETNNIINTCESRIPGSSGENQALDHIMEELTPLCGQENVVKQRFKVAPRAFFGWTYFTIIFLILGIGLYYMTPVFSILCYVIAFIPFLLESLLHIPFLDSLFEYGTSANVIGMVKPNSDIKRRIVFSSNIDSSYEWHLNKIGGYKLILAFSIISIIGLIYSLAIAIVTCIVNGPVGTPKGGIFYASFATIIFVPFYLSFFKFCNYKKVSGGASVNLAACELNVAILKTLKENNVSLENTEVDVLILGSKNAGIRGSKAFTRMNQGFGKEENIETIFINYDSLCNADKLSICKKDLNGLVKNNIDVCNFVQSTAKDMNLNLSYTTKIGASDSAAFSKAGLKSISINGINLSIPRYYNTTTDTIDTVSKDCLSKMLDLSLNLIENFDKNGILK